MLKNRHEQIQFAVRLADILICIIAFYGAYWVRTSPLAWNEAKPIEPIENFSWLLGASLVLHFLIYPALGFYQSLRLKEVSHIIGMVLRAGIIEFFVLGALVFFLQEKDTSRYFFGLFISFNYALVLAEKIGARVLLSSVRRRGCNFRQVLVYGTGVNARKVIQALRRNKHWGYLPVGIISEPHAEKIQTMEDLPVLGHLNELESIAAQRTVDEVYFAADYLDSTGIGDQIALCEKLGIPARLSLGFIDLSGSKITFSQLDDIPVLTYYTTLMTPAQALIKRALDIIIALIGLCITAVLYPWIAWRIKKQSPGPVIFKQIRVGENGRKFKCYKFRTMDVDADQKKQSLLAQNVMQGPLFKLENDPRIFPFGAFLRKTSLDELPQFLNILRGDMSVVGTRPPTPDEVQQYKTHFRRRLSIRPGLTGLWQVSGRNQIKRFEDVLALDLKYIDQWSLWLDIRIIVRTIWVALFGRGAF